MVARKIYPEAQGSAESMPFPAPVKGLNTRDSYIALGQDEARELINFLPQTGACTVRPGYSPFATISGSKQVKTLARVAIGGTNSLLAASNGTLWNVISGTPASLATGYTNDHWSTAFLGGYLFGVNGTDTPFRYDGSTVSATGFSGPTLTSMRTIKAVQFRLWATINNSGDVWYGPLEGVTGPFTIFQISQISDGGYCVGVFAWQAQNATVFCMSTGQVLVYQGDPTTNITLATKYYAPPLIEPDAAVQMGGELILLTTSGPISMDLVAAGLGFELDALGVWGKIWPSWQTDYATYGVNSGWFGKFINGLCYFNVATGTATTKQYVFNTRNQAWTTYQGLPIASLEQVGNTIYIGSSNTDGGVFTHSGGQDNGASIFARGRPGFSYLGKPNRKKTFSLIKPNIFTTGALTVQAQMDVDFQTSPITAPAAVMSAGGTSTPWGSAWGSSWAMSNLNKPQWLGTAASGHAASAVIQTLSSGTDVQWFSTDAMTMMGGAL
jgi:hypothetical protein